MAAGNDSEQIMPDGLPVMHRERVRGDWIDYNGHMNVAYFVLAFDFAVDVMWARLEIDDAYREATGCSTFAVESHVTYQREMKLDDEMLFTVQLLGYDDKRIHHFYRMYHAREGYLAATCEWLNLHVDLSVRRVAPMPAAVVARLEEMLAVSRVQGWPAEAGRAIRRPRQSIHEGASGN
jgi:acyl-CoA thioester hydrolase